MDKHVIVQLPVYQKLLLIKSQEIAKTGKGKSFSQIIDEAIT